MKRNYNNAFTLTEILIALSVIGVVAATIIPLANKYKPDEDKVKYLQAYDAITHTVKRMAQDETAFSALLDLNGEKYDISDVPFMDISDVPSMRNGMAFCQNFVQNMNAVETSQACTTNGNQTTAQFMTKNGVAWTLSAEQEVTGTNIHFLSTVEVWLDGDRGNPDKHHTLQIGPDGKIAIRDEKGLYYHSTRAFWRKTDYRKEDYENLEDLTTESTIQLDTIKIEEPVQNGWDETSASNSTSGTVDGGTDNNAGDETSASGSGSSSGAVTGGANDTSDETSASGTVNGGGYDSYYDDSSYSEPYYGEPDYGDTSYGEPDYDYPGLDGPDIEDPDLVDPGNDVDSGTPIVDFEPPTAESWYNEETGESGGFKQDENGDWVFDHGSGYEDDRGYDDDRSS